MSIQINTANLIQDNDYISRYINYLLTKLIVERSSTGRPVSTSLKFYVKKDFDINDFLNSSGFFDKGGDDDLQLKRNYNDTSERIYLYLNNDLLEETFFVKTCVSEIGGSSPPQKEVSFKLYCDEVLWGKEKTEFLHRITQNKDFIYELTKPQGTIYVMTKDNSGLRLTSLGSSFTPLERENYNPEVIQAYDYVIEEFNKPNPNGFITILSGPAGSGKSFLIRSILGNIEKAKFVFISPAYVSSLASPDFLPLLIEEMNDYDYDVGPKNIILILEDADEVLAPRMTDNVHQISTLLNMTDGILGRSLNLRIIATTNQKQEAFDSAIMRPGRLCNHIKVDKLKPEQARKVYSRLAGEDHPTLDGEMSVAEIYSFVATFKRTGTHVELKQARKVGF